MQQRILFTVIAAVFIALLGIGVIIPVLPQFAVRLGAGGFALGLITAAFSLSRGLLQPLVGDLSDRWGRKHFLVTGLFIYGLVGLLAPMAVTITHLILIRILQGAGAAMIVPVAMAYGSAAAPPGEEGKYMGIINAAVFCGIGFGPVIGGLIGDSWGLASVFYVMAMFAAIGLVFVFCFLPASDRADIPPPVGIIKNMGRMVRRKRSLGILLARFSTVLMMVPTMAFLPLVMSSWPNGSGLRIGVIMASRTLVNALLQMPFGRLADRYDKLVLLLGGCLCASIALACIPWADQFLSMIALYLLLGLGESALWPALGAYAAQEGRNHFGHGAMMGVFNLAMSAGVFTGALFAGASSDMMGLDKAFYFTALATLLLTSLAAVLIRRGEKEDDQRVQRKNIDSLSATMQRYE